MASRALKTCRLGHPDEEAHPVQVDYGHNRNSLFASTWLVLIEQQLYCVCHARGGSNRAGWCGARPALPRGAHPLGMARPAGDGRPAATDLRPHEVGPDERQLESGTTPLPPEPPGERAAPPRARAPECREGTPKA